MIIKGGAIEARAADIRFIAEHLQRLDTNEEFCIREISGTVATDLLGALEELAGHGAGARTRRPLYTASVSPDPAQALLTEGQWATTTRWMEDVLEFAGQPRIVVSHRKNGRDHRHYVWSRINLDTMTAIHDGHDRRRLHKVARDLEREFGHQPATFTLMGDVEALPGRSSTWAEQQQAYRNGITPSQLAERVTGVWSTTDSGQSFRDALAEIGMVLARGDKRGLVIVDPDLQVHGVTRQIKGIRAAEVVARMDDLDIDTLPSVADAKSDQRKRFKMPWVLAYRLGIPASPGWEVVDYAPWEQRSERRMDTEPKADQTSAPDMQLLVPGALPVGATDVSIDIRQQSLVPGKSSNTELPLTGKPLGATPPVVEAAPDALNIVPISASEVDSALVRRRRYIRSQPPATPDVPAFKATAASDQAAEPNPPASPLRTTVKPSQPGPGQSADDVSASLTLPTVADVVRPPALGTSSLEATSTSRLGVAVVIVGEVIVGRHKKWPSAWAAALIRATTPAERGAVRAAWEAAMPQADDRVAVEYTVTKMLQINPAATLAWAKSMPTPDEVTTTTRAAVASQRQKRAIARRSGAQLTQSTTDRDKVDEGQSRVPAPSTGGQAKPSDAGIVIVPGSSLKLGIGPEPAGKSGRKRSGIGRGPKKKGR